MSLAIITPTRGVLLSKVAEAVERERASLRKQGIATYWYISHDLTIPHCFNHLTDQALKDGHSGIIYIEEDTVPPVGAFRRLVEANSPIACIDYGVNGWGCVTRDNTDRIRWCGLGCTLVLKEVFLVMEEPYFRTDKTLRINDRKWIDLPKDYMEKRQYGGQDIWFFYNATERGFEIVQVEGECEHLNLVSLGVKERNNGLHEIKPKPKIEHKQRLD